MTTIDRTKLNHFLESELASFKNRHPRSYEMYIRAQNSLLAGVPMNWMVRWAGGFPLFVKEAHGAHFTCVDGHDYVDFCLGDTGAMTGHSPVASMTAIKEQLDHGITFMLPTEDSIWVGEEMQRRFGLKVLADHPHSHGCQPLHFENCTAYHPAAVRTCLQLLLSRFSG